MLGFAKISAMTTAVLPIPTSDASHPPLISLPPLIFPTLALPLGARSFRTMKAKHCRWYGFMAWTVIRLGLANS